MKNIITKVISNRIAEEVGIEVSDILLSINGNKINDIIDYKFFQWMKNYFRSRKDKMEKYGKLKLKKNMVKI